VDVCPVIKRRLDELGLEQKDLAAAVEVKGIYQHLSAASWAVAAFRNADFSFPIRNFSHRKAYTCDTLTSPEKLRKCQTKSGSKHLKTAEE
jgi:hypothetical protein